MKATQRLHDLGQSLWPDNITRGLLTKGSLRRDESWSELIECITAMCDVLDRADKKRRTR